MGNESRQSIFVQFLGLKINDFFGSAVRMEKDIKEAGIVVFRNQSTKKDVFLKVKHWVSVEETTILEAVRILTNAVLAVLRTTPNL